MRNDHICLLYFNHAMTATSLSRSYSPYGNFALAKISQSSHRRLHKTIFKHDLRPRHHALRYPQPKHTRPSRVHPAPPPLHPSSPHLTTIDPPARSPQPSSAIAAKLPGDVNSVSPLHRVSAVRTVRERMADGMAFA